MQYGVTDHTPRYEKEFVVPLPFYTDPTTKASKNPVVAAQSEIFHVKDGQFFVLARDSKAGHGQASSTSIYRHIDVFDIANATNIKGNNYDCATCCMFPVYRVSLLFPSLHYPPAIASLAGVLNTTITPATYCPFLDFNVNSQLNRFGMHNGGAQDARLLNEKWESIGLVPVDGIDGADGEWFVFSLSDNDFITQDGHLEGGKFVYADASGYNLDNQALVFKVSLPTGSKIFSGVV